MADDPVRKQLADFLNWHQAHVGFDDAVKGVPAKLRGAVPPGFVHSIWQVVEHLRFTQSDILEFCRSRKYREKKWPNDYWPKSPSPKNASAWTDAISSFRKDRKAIFTAAAHAERP